MVSTAELLRDSDGQLECRLIRKLRREDVSESFGAKKSGFSAHAQFVSCLGDLILDPVTPGVLVKLQFSYPVKQFVEIDALLLIHMRPIPEFIPQ